MTVQVERDGSLLVDEVIAFQFDGSFSGAFREIPLREGESIDQVFVAEGDREYAPGGCAELQCSSPDGTFGTTPTSEGIRVVWHYRANSEARRFRVHYRLRGLAEAYDDVVDVNLQVWGEEWEVGLDQLTSTLVAPGEVVRAWGHPVGVRGDVTLDESRVDLRAERIPSGQFVELRALVPRRFFTSTAGMKVVGGLGLEAIAAAEREDAAAYEHNRRKIDDALQNLPWTIAKLLALALLPALAVIGFVWARWGRERGWAALDSVRRPAHAFRSVVAGSAR